MTIAQAIQQANEMKEGNSMPEETKIRKLSELDAALYLDVIAQHQPMADTPQPRPYSADDTAAELLAPAPFDILYIYWLMAQIDLFAQEINKYNDDFALFQQAQDQYCKWYRRTHAPLPLPDITVGGMR